MYLAPVKKHEFRKEKKKEFSELSKNVGVKDYTDLREMDCPIASQFVGPS